MDKISNKYKWLVAALLIAITVGVLSFLVMNQRKAGVSTIQSSIQNMGHLVALKINVKDVEKTVYRRHFPLGQTTVILVYTGNCTIATDLRMITYKSIDKNNRTVTLVLPAPTIDQAQVNLSDTVECNSGILSILPGAGNVPPIVIKAALEKAQKKVEAEGKKPEVIDAAKVNTETILKGLLTSLDWTATIEWK